MSSISRLSPEPPIVRPQPQPEKPPPPKAPEKQEDAAKVTAAKPAGTGRVVDIRA